MSVPEKRCFTYCGPERCNCAARELADTLVFVEPALPVLATMCGKVGLAGGQAKAREMHAAVKAALGDREPR